MKKHLTVNASIRKDRSQINNLTIHLNKLEKAQIMSKTSRTKKIRFSF